MNWDIGTVASIAGAVIGALGLKGRKKGRKKNPENETVENINKPDFRKLLSIVKDKSRKETIINNLQKISKKDFTIDIYEVQVEINPINDDLQQRYLHTICSTYNDPKDTPIWKEPGVYCGQTPYAFIKNRYMWITDKRGGCLSKATNENVEYVDRLSNTPSGEIPDFWTLENTSKRIQTSVILPLRLSGETIACFGFIDFESVRCIEFNQDLFNLFKKIAAVFALDYLENIVKQMK